MTSELISETELPKKIGVSLWTIRNWRQTAGMPFVKVRSRYYYRLEAVSNWIESMEKNSLPEQENSQEKAGSGVIRKIKA